MRKVTAILCSDLHLSLKAPVARSGEPDWMAAQARTLDQLKSLQKDNGCPPILLAGDLFDRWNSPPELINFALETLPDNLWAIPGQHDLPLHSLDLIRKSAYHTLVSAGKVTNLPGGKARQLSGDWWVIGFPWGWKGGIEGPPSGARTVGLAHEYVWLNKATSYPGAPAEAQVERFAKQYQFLNVKLMAVGDNHQGFRTEVKSMVILNCGTMMRRKSDEFHYEPQVGVLFEDGGLETWRFDVSQDTISPTEAHSQVGEDMELKDFLAELAKLQSTSLDFRDAVTRALDEIQVSREVRKIVLEAMP